jgi:prepilin-type N-terminal cleavage/methylation domain-containing protein
MITKSNQTTTYNSQLITRSGFTLLELLVVISIIVILITLGLSSFATAQKKGRDAKRKSDIKEIQTALEQYYSACGYVYPTVPGGSNFYSSINCSSRPYRSCR